MTEVNGHLTSHAYPTKKMRMSFVSYKFDIVIQPSNELPTPEQSSTNRRFQFGRETVRDWPRS